MAAAQAQVFKYAQAQKPKEEDKRSSDFEARLIKTGDEYYALTRQSRDHRYPRWLYADLFAKGIHYFLYDPVYAAAQEMSQQSMDACMYTPTPLMQQAVEMIAAQYGSSNGRAVLMSLDSSDPKKKAVVRNAQDYVEYLDWKFYQSNPAGRQTECKLIPLRGIYSYVEYDRTRGEKIELPQYEGQEKKVCADCGYEVGGNGQTVEQSMGSYAGVGDADGSYTDSIAATSRQVDASGQPAQACPHCNSTNIQTVTAGITNRGNTERRLGEPVRRIYDAFQVEVYDRNRCIEDSPYLFCDDILFKTEAKKLYPHLKEIEGKASFGDFRQGYIGLHFLTQLQCVISNSGGLDQSKPEYVEGLGARTWNVTNYGSFLNPLLCWRRRVWFDTEIYADWTIGDLKPIILPGRTEPIPPETKVIEVFPDGLCFHVINGDCVVLTENQNKNDVWSFCGYRMPSTGFHGTGVNSLISLVRGYDTANSFALQALLMAALGIVVKDERVPGNSNVPGSTIIIPQNARLANEPITSLVGRLETGGGQAIAAAQPIKEGFRGSIGDLSMAANPYGTGLSPQGVGSETATAVKYNAGAVGTLVNPPLELYSAHRAKVIQQAIELERKNGLRPKRFGKFGATVTKWFDASEIPEDLQVGVAPESWRMRTLETEREDVALAVQLKVEMIQNEALRTKAYQVLGLDDDIDDSSDWEVLAEKRLDALKSLAPEFEAVREQAEMQGQQMMMQAEEYAASNTQEGLLIAQQLQMQAQQMSGQAAMQLIEAAKASPTPMDATGHPVFIRAYVDAYQSDEWEEFSPVLQSAIQQLWQMHQQGVGQAGAIQTEQQLIATEPARQAQKEDAAEAQQMQAGLESEEQEAGNQQAMMQAEHEDERAVLEADERERDREFQSTEAERERQHQKELARMKETKKEG